MEKKAIIIGAGPAGLTAAYELLKRTDIVPIVLEKSGDIGGISKTIHYKGNRMDMGPHRFFSKSNRVMDWWMNMMPLYSNGNSGVTVHYRNQSHNVTPVSEDDGHLLNGATKKMLVIKRLTRIYFLNQFFTYPLQLSIETLRKLGVVRTFRILVSYMQAQLMPVKPEKTLQDFIINRFGRQLYGMFFKDYTEKVWGVPCDQISAEWGAQRIKGVSISKAVLHAVRSSLKQKNGQHDVHQANTETSLIEQFLYPSLGAGHMWEEVANRVRQLGGQILLQQDVKRIITDHDKVLAISAADRITGEQKLWDGDYFFSTMPVQELIAGIDCQRVPDDVRHVAAGLQYRDFINVGVLLRKLHHQNGARQNGASLSLKDNWLYIQDKNVKVGRIQLYNNWGPYMVNDPNTVWIGLEYFCNIRDDFWQYPDEKIQQLAIRELEQIGLIKREDVLDTTLHRLEKTYPAYFGTYDQFQTIRDYTDHFTNLFLVGRNGMHKYNNTDHSMLTAMVAVDNICDGITTKANLWSINTEQEYHEEKATT